MTAPQLDRLDVLVESAAGGDVDAFGQLLNATSGMVTSIVLAIVRDVDMSQDIAQEVFLSAWRDLKKLRNPASFLPWLRQIARNHAHHALRTRIRRRRWLVPFAGQEGSWRRCLLPIPVRGNVSSRPSNASLYGTRSPRCQTTRARCSSSSIGRDNRSRRWRHCST